MDFSKITENLSPFIEKAKIYGTKWMEFAQKQAQNTPIFLKTEEEYKALLEAKRSILIAYNETDPLAQEVLLRSIVWSTKAYMDNAQIRFISIQANESLAKNLNITGPIEMRITYAGVEYLRTNNLEDILKWWDNRCYHTDGDIHTESPIHDPLNQQP